MECGLIKDGPILSNQEFLGIGWIMYSKYGKDVHNSEEIHLKKLCEIRLLVSDQMNGDRPLEAL
jgi:hypothetical protein